MTVAVGAVPGTGILTGTVWHDANFDDTLDAAERVLVGWTVTLLVDDRALRSVTTGADLQ